MNPFKCFSVLLIIIFSTGFVYSQTKINDYRDADKLFSEEKWADAASAYLSLATENPFNGYYLDNYSYCLYSMKQYDSGLSVSCSSRYRQNYLPDDYRKWIAPKLGVRYYFNDFKNGIDPAMNQILNFSMKGVN